MNFETEREKELFEKVQKLHIELAEMEGDIRSALFAIHTILVAFKINPNELSTDTETMNAHLPILLGKVTRGFGNGAFDRIAGVFRAMAPLTDKYKHLYTNDTIT